MKQHLVLIAIVLGITVQAGRAQDTATLPTPAPQKPELQFYPSQSIEIRGLLEEGESFTSYLLVSSNRKISLTAKLKPLKDDYQSSFLHSDYLSASPNPLNIEAGQSVEFSITVEEGAAPGNYRGEMELTAGDGVNSWTIPVMVSLRRVANAKIYPDDESPLINTASRSPFNFLLPRNIRQEGINIRIDNESEEGLAVSNISLALKGENTNAAFTEAMLSPDTNLLRTGIDAKGLETLRLRFNKEALNGLPNDTYKGEFRVYFKDAAEPLTTPVTVNKRMGAFGAIILLILGIIAYRWIKGLDKARNQMELMERFVPLRVKVGQLTDKLTVKSLQDELAQLETKINKVQDDESKAEVEALFSPLEKKIDQIRELEALFERLNEQFSDDKAPAAIKTQASQQLRTARDAILDGREEETQEALKQLDELIQSLNKDKSKGILDEVVLPAAQAVMRQMDKLFEVVEKKRVRPVRKGNRPSGRNSCFAPCSGFRE